jgi:hypothetical protein
MREEEQKAVSDERSLPRLAIGGGTNLIETAHTQLE